jgi:hypothetical protein
MELGHEAWIEAYFSPRPNSLDAVSARKNACHCDGCDAKRAKRKKVTG